MSIWEHVWISRSNHVIRLQLPWRRSTPECPNPSADGRCRWGACAQARCCSIPWPSSSHHLIFFGIELDHGSNKIDKDPKRKNCMFVEFHTKYPQQTENSPQKKIMQHVFKARTAVARPNSNSNAWRPGNLNCTAWVSKAWRKVWQVQSIQFTNSSQFTTVFSHVYESTKLIRMACWSKGRPVVPWWSIQTFRRPMLPPWWICKSCPGPNTLQAKFSEQMQKPCHLTKKMVHPTQTWKHSTSINQFFLRAISTCGFFDWSRLISVDVALWFSSGAAFHAFLSIFSASAALHEANLLSLLTELLTLHHDAIPLFSGNVLIWTKKNTSISDGTETCGPLVCLANPEKKVTTHQFVPRHFRIRAMPPGRPETRELRRPCRFCDGKTGFSTMKEHKWTTNHPTSSRCLQTLLLVPKICNRPKIGFDFTLTSLGPWKATHRGAEGISLWLSAMTTTWAAASASHTWQESIGRARQWREKYLENVPIQWNSMQCNDMQSMQRNAKECNDVQWNEVK